MVQILEVKESLGSLAIAASLSKELAETAVERDAKAGSPEYEIQRLRESGLLPLVVPKEYGGIAANWAEPRCV